VIPEETGSHCSRILAVSILLHSVVLASSGSSNQKVPIDAIGSAANLVIVPTVVRSSSNETVKNLHASDFQLTDNGVVEKVYVDEVQGQGIAIVVLMQTGAAAPQQFKNFRTVTNILSAMLGTTSKRVALLTFDSQPEQIWNFPSMVDRMQGALQDPNAGDNGAAIMDALYRGMDLLNEQPVSLRRVILLISKPKDSGSKSTPAEVVRRLGESNTTVYSVTFPPDKTLITLEHSEANFSDEVRQVSQDQARLSGKSNPNSLLPDDVAKEIRDRTAEEVAKLSGGEQIRLKDKEDLKSKLSVLATAFANSYMLSFRPTSRTPGFHTIDVRLKAKNAHFSLTTRTSYWKRDARPPER
jgi:VWFA-related protein